MPAENNPHMMMHWLKAVLILSGAAGIWRSYTGHAEFAGPVAIHFGAGGRPDSWAGSEMMTAFYAGLYVSLTILFLFLPRLLFILPPRLVNFPEKEYWLERAKKAQNFPVVASWFYALGVLMNLMFLAVGELVFEANRSAEGRLNEPLFLKVFGVFVFLILAWVVSLYRRFRRPHP